MSRISEEMDIRREILREEKQRGYAANKLNNQYIKNLDYLTINNPKNYDFINNRKPRGPINVRPIENNGDSDEEELQPLSSMRNDNDENDENDENDNKNSGSKNKKIIIISALITFIIILIACVVIGIIYYQKSSSSSSSSSSGDNNGDELLSWHFDEWDYDNGYIKLSNYFYTATRINTTDFFYNVKSNVEFNEGTGVFSWNLVIGNGAPGPAINSLIFGVYPSDDFSPQGNIFVIGKGWGWESNGYQIVNGKVTTDVFSVKSNTISASLTLDTNAKTLTFDYLESSIVINDIKFPVVAVASLKNENNYVTLTNLKS